MNSIEQKFNRHKANASFLRGEYKEAFNDYFDGATREHDSYAAFNCAYMYHRGIYVPRNYPMARSFYIAALSLDGGEPYFNLALMHMRGMGGETDFFAAVECMKRSAASGCVDAQNYLGVAYTLGYVFDPVDIECLSLIPFHRVIKSAPRGGELKGVTLEDIRIEDSRYEAIRADEYSAIEMLEQAAAHEDTYYIEEQVGAARFLLGQALCEGFGAEYSPQKGYALIEKAAIENGSRDAAIFLSSHEEAALAYGVDIRRIKGLLKEK